MPTGMSCRDIMSYDEPCGEAMDELVGCRIRRGGDTLALSGETCTLKGLAKLPALLTLKERCERPPLVSGGGLRRLGIVIHINSYKFLVTLNTP